MTMTSLRMPDDLAIKLNNLATKLKRKKGWLMNEAIREYVEREERRQQMLRETMEGIESLEIDEVIDGNDVLKWLGTWGTEEETPHPKQC